MLTLLPAAMAKVFCASFKQNNTCYSDFPGEYLANRSLFSLQALKRLSNQASRQTLHPSNNFQIYINAIAPEILYFRPDVTC